MHVTGSDVSSASAAQSKPAIDRSQKRRNEWLVRWTIPVSFTRRFRSTVSQAPSSPIGGFMPPPSAMAATVRIRGSSCPRSTARFEGWRAPIRRRPSTHRDEGTIPTIRHTPAYRGTRSVRRLPPSLRYNNPDVGNDRLFQRQGDAIPPRQPTRHASSVSLMMFSPGG